MFKPAKVVMFPTTEKVINSITLLDNRLIKIMSYFQIFAKKIMSYFQIFAKAQHLYIISDEVIKEDDWYYAKGLNKIIKSDGSYTADSEKIIATTDLSLEIARDIKSEYCNNHEIIGCNLPQLSQSFIDKYINEYNKGNIITDVMIEYEEFVIDGNDHFLVKRYYSEKSEITKEALNKVEYFTRGGLMVANRLVSQSNIIQQLKVNSKDNTVTIKRVKDSYNREETIKIAREAFENACKYSSFDDFKEIHF